MDVMSSPAITVTLAASTVAVDLQVAPIRGTAPAGER
jgi:hypothetical protein